jgi:hypothetical protein
MGYHIKDIPKGDLGELSKIQEELLEAMDAEEQGNRIMTLLELSDLIGAVEAYLKNHYDDSFTLTDLLIMKEATNRAFLDGTRQ